MSFFKKLRRDIHINFAESNQERSHFLWQICKDILRSSPDLYLDVGTYSGNNALTFGKEMEAGATIGVDLKIPNKNALKSSPKSMLIAADGLKLPFNKSTFDVVSLFSVIEHVPSSKLLCKEVFRVLKKGGTVIIQVPNRYFPIELHSSLPFLFYFPRNLRVRILKTIGYRSMISTEVPSLKNLISIIKRTYPNGYIIVRKINYPTFAVPSNVRRVYHIAKKTGLLNVLPLGYLIAVKCT